uniref:Thioredoxin domain-containing protein n=1 Tax=Timema poppense TaxID=170557 RepID=A0A7R9H0I3_TIMPO|nr:unnamed protein product [Timema poppensis]
MSDILLLEVNHHVAKQSTQKANAVEEVSDFKEFKKLLRTKNNVLVCFVSSSKQASPIIKIFREAAESVKGQGTMLLIDCSGESKKMCKKLKVNPNPFVLKHYKDGEYHKDYDRLQTAQSMVKFMRDPAGDIPWEEDSAAEDVMHISDALTLNRFLKKELKPTLVMFYAPWCGFCKQLKPEYAAAAAQLKGHSILAAIDVNRPENTVIRHQYNITGFPTMLYFENGYQKYIYEGENNKDGLIGFMKNPRKPAGKPKGSEWAQVKSEVVHLTSDTFDAFLKLEPSVLVMFYAPWCGHCTRMKPEYEKAAETLKKENIPGALAAVDATKETVVASKYSISGYPSVKYFKNGEFAFDTNLRDAGKILEFMRNPRKPPPPPPPEQPWSEEPSEVVHLDAETFKPFLKKKKHTLVMFYAPSEPGSWETHLFLHVQSFRGGGGFGADSWPISAFGLASVFDLIWCGHCKKAKPEFVAAAEEFKDDSKVEFAAVDCTLHSSVCSALEVKGYPTIKYFHYYNKETKNYSGGRVKADLVNFMLDPLNPLAGMINTSTVEAADKPPAQEWGTFPGAEHVVHLNDDSFDKVIGEGNPVLVMFYAPWCGHCKKMKPAYSEAALKLHKDKSPSYLAAVDSTVNPRVTERYKIQAFPTLKLFNKGKFASEYEKPRTAEDITAFMKSVEDASIKKKDEL